MHHTPPPFNPRADANGAARYAMVTGSMTADDYYNTHTREECKTEWKRRYELLLATTLPFISHIPRWTYPVEHDPVLIRNGYVHG